MIGASKILTVSYGTFSCTLEGFDDPFNTMKAIAEYFRDLAAEDRYFGAEPPTPDAAMLHKIAEREIQRRVEAKIQENGVILRAGEAAAPQQIAAPVPTLTASSSPAMAEAPRLAPQPLAQPMPRITMPAAEAPRPAPVAPRASVTESVAEKLMRIRSVAAQTAAPYGEEEDFAPKAAADQLPEDRSPEPTSAELSLADILPEDIAPQAEPESLAAESAPEVPPEAPPEVATVETAPQDEPFAASPILAAQDALPDSAFSPAEADFGGVLTSDTPAAAETPDLPMPEAQDAADLDEDALIAGLSLLETAPQPAPRDAPEMGPEAIALPADDSPEEDSDDDLSDLLAALADEAPAVPPAAAAAPSGETAWGNHDQQDDDLIADFLADDASETAGTAEPAPEMATDTGTTESEARVERARARVIRIRRAPATPVELAETVAETADVVEAAAEPVLSPEAEADLLRELAELEAEHTPTAPVAEAATDQTAAGVPEREAEAAFASAAPAAPQPAPAPVRPARPVRRLRVARSEPAPVTPATIEPRLPETLPPARGAADPRTPQLEGAQADAAMTRLIAETNSQLAGPDNRRRLSAIAHLKAAVAATVADRRAGGAPAKSDAARVEPYREDLSRIVRPSGASAAAVPTRPAPLVLVSELRVDRPAPRSTEPAPGPVRPRRIVSGSAALASQPFDDDDDEDDEPNIFTDSKGFAEFAERIGVEGFPALLEAAAAYAACVEGRPHFSRPQLMRQVSDQAEEEGVSREDGLRYFGTLLREGRIVKVRRGQYALAEDSHLLAKARKLVG